MSEEPEITNAAAIRRSVARLLLPGALGEPPVCSGMMHPADVRRESAALVDKLTAGLEALPERVREAAGDEAAAVTERRVEGMIYDLRQRLEDLTDQTQRD